MAESANNNSNSDGNYDAVSDILTALIMIGYAIFMFVGAMNFPSRRNMGFITSPRFTPILLSITIFIFLIILIIQKIKEGNLVNLRDWVKAVVRKEENRRFFILFLIISTYIYFIGDLNFLLLNFLFYVVSFYYLRVGSISRILLYGTVCTILVGYVVPKIFSMPIP